MWKYVHLVRHLPIIYLFEMFVFLLLFLQLYVIYGPLCPNYVERYMQDVHIIYSLNLDFHCDVSMFTYNYETYNLSYRFISLITKAMYQYYNYIVCMLHPL